jgi:ATP-dependent Clp protease ATP-binding subunit ClpB
VADFTNSIIIATSNAGSELIRERVTEGKTGETLKTELLNYLQTNSIFRPEFLNRFDEVVSFHPLTKEQIIQVALLMLKGLSSRMLEKEITVEFTEAAVNKLAEAGFDPVYGARPMRRAIQDKVENLLANKLLSGEIARGAHVRLDEGDIV